MNDIQDPAAPAPHGDSSDADAPAPAPHALPEPAAQGAEPADLALPVDRAQAAAGDPPQVQAAVDAQAEAGVAPPPPAPAGARRDPRPQASTMSHAACTALLQQHFPALFGAASPIRPLKLQIQSDIQVRAPGVFSKAALSQFLRRYTASPAYQQALARMPQRHDLDGRPAGEVSDEHRQAAREELQRRRSAIDAQRAQEDEARRGRARLLRDFETTTLTRANFCALKGVDDDALDALLALARQEAAQRPPPPMMRREPERRPAGADGDRRDPRRAGPPRRP